MTTQPLGKTAALANRAKDFLLILDISFWECPIPDQGRLTIFKNYRPYWLVWLPHWFEIVICIQRRLTPFPFLSYFPQLFVWRGCILIFGQLLHIYPGKAGNLVSLLVYSQWLVQIIGYIIAWRSCSFVCWTYLIIIIDRIKCLSDIFYRGCV